jgi:hypothetical protein
MTDDAEYVIVPPARAPPRAQRLPVKRNRDLSQRAALVAQGEDLGQCRLLGWLWLDMLAIRRESIPISDVPTHRPLDFLCCIASRVRSPIASRSHCETAVIMLITSLPAAEPVSSDSATDTNDTPRRWNRSSNSARSFTLRVSRSSLAMMTVSSLRSSTNTSKRSMPGRFKSFADSPPSTINSIT